MKVAALSLLAGLLRSSSASECGLSFADVEPCDQVSPPPHPDQCIS